MPLAAVVLAGGARLFIGRHVAVRSLFFPARSPAAGIPRASHAARAIFRVPAEIKLKKMANRRDVKAFSHKLLNEPQTLDISF